MSIDLAGARVLVTGASSGIGEATARSLSALGAHVVLAGRRAERLHSLATELPSKSHVIVGDLTEGEAARELVDDAVSALGGLDIVVNNAGLLLPGPVEAAPVEEWDRMIAVNLIATIRVAHAALPHLLRSATENPRKVSDLVMVSSVSGRRALPGSAVYNSTKWGVNGFSESLRQEVATRGVRVALIEPGSVATELPDHMRAAVRSAPNPAFTGFEPLEAEDIGEAIAFVVTRPKRAAVNEILIRPTGQTA